MKERTTEARFIMLNTIGEQQKEITELRAALRDQDPNGLANRCKDYMTHRDDCRYLHSVGTIARCDCGLLELFKEIRGE